ncbi:AAA family ATPase [Schaedlerella sp.]|uniref:AAA family ATPase n=1 Tax=Schaedlerella sp. TaxID=2676057 RepID=UPI003744F414
MPENIRIPIGEENFELLRKRKCYYIDKTKLIRELLEENFKVSLFTRPRRFGKTLNMSMMEAFFDIRRDSREIFAGLEIMEQEELCAEWMNQSPVLSISFKDVANDNFEDSYEQLQFELSSLCIEHTYLLDSEKTDLEEQACFARLKAGKASETEVRNSLFILTRMLHAYYGKPVILLIDEYDVPLAKASEHGYYSQMLNVIRTVMSKSLKSNPFLQFAVLTGCLRVAKESIFTGVNHFKCNSISGNRFLDCFGFTEPEVAQMLQDAGLTSRLSSVRQWYNGYHFGKQDVYCPWDVSNFVSDARLAPDLAPENYWKDTSHNSIIRQFIGRDGLDVNKKLEKLLSGGSIQTRLTEDSTYDLEHAGETDFWSILYFTGYLTIDREDADCRDGEVSLRIPNEEVRTIFGDTIVVWFGETIGIRAAERSEMFGAWWSGDENAVTDAVSFILNDTISYYDYREDYYHAFVAGLFFGAGYLVTSNDENGLGRPDVVVKDRKTRKVIIIEAKHSDSEADMEADCQKALRQADLQQYASRYLNGYKTIQCYGAAFFQKKCLIRKVTLPGLGKGSLFEIE